MDGFDAAEPEGSRFEGGAEGCLESALFVDLFRAAGGVENGCFFASQKGCGSLIGDSIGEAKAQDSVDPALEDGGHGKPPDGMDENEEFGFFDELLFVGDVRAGGTLLDCFEIGRSQDWIEADSVKVPDGAGMSFGQEDFDDGFEDRVVEAGGVGVGIHGQNIHKRPPFA